MKIRCHSDEDHEPTIGGREAAVWGRGVTIVVVIHVARAGMIEVRVVMTAADMTEARVETIVAADIPVVQDVMIAVAIHVARAGMIEVHDETIVADTTEVQGVMIGVVTHVARAGMIEVHDEMTVADTLVARSVVAPVAIPIHVDV